MTTAPVLAPSALRAAPAVRVPTLVLGGSGYVAGEILRLLIGHPGLAPAAVFSDSQPGTSVGSVFPHLSGCLGDLRFASLDDLESVLHGMMEQAADSGVSSLGALSAAPHGAAAGLVDRVLATAERHGISLRLVDLSADFRFATAAAYEDVYGHAHGAPERLARFHCSLPEHAPTPEGPIGHPGCFTTSVLIPSVALLARGWIEPRLVAVGVTGSTGAGRTPTATTHHPARRSNLFAYGPLHHRHEPEMRALAAAASGVPAVIHFVPQAGPFARGIYTTVQARLARPATAAEVTADLMAFYAAAPFVDVLAEPPRLQDVVGTNRCRISVAVAGDQLVAFSAIDNLTKGAAGGGVQWLNRLLGLPETMGLELPGIGWL
jgi:N-acetyl-gamma-glutamyl-phosphate reductase common form